LPKSEQTNISLSISRAYMEFDYDKAKSALELIADNLDHRIISITGIPKRRKAYAKVLRKP
jgi:hypothetical protein